MSDHPSPPRRVLPEVDVGRRRFLTAAGLAGAGAVAAAGPLSPAEAAESPYEMVAGRYRVNRHVERFYHLNRL